MLVEFNERRLLIQNEINAIPNFQCKMPGGAFYAFPNIKRTGLSSVELQDLLLDKSGVATIAGSSFGINGQGYLRISYANSKENLLDAVSRIKETI